jgi:hypothetical protein
MPDGPGLQVTESLSGPLRLIAIGSDGLQDAPRFTADVVQFSVEQALIIVVRHPARAIRDNLELGVDIEDLLFRARKKCPPEPPIAWS